MILKCVKAMGEYKVGDEVTWQQLLDEGMPHPVIGYCFVEKPEPKPKVVKLAIIEADGRLGCWVPHKDYELVLKEKAEFTGSRRWLPLETIPGLASAAYPVDKDESIMDWSELRRNRTDGGPADWPAAIVFAAKE